MFKKVNKIKKPLDINFKVFFSGYKLVISSCFFFKLLFINPVMINTSREKMKISQEQVH